jgi:aspartate aminotransferase-like enzyme
MMHHRTPEFSNHLEDMIEWIRPLFGTSGDVLPIHGTGRAAMEAAICNLFSPGDELVACCNGKFGEMWAKFADSYGVVVHRICSDWTRDVDPDEVEAALKQYPKTRGITFVYCDSTTGVLNDAATVCGLARQHGALALVDCICATGGVPFEFESWGADVAVTASQKCLMSSTGLSFAAVSNRVWDAVPQASLPRNYFDFTVIRESLARARPETPGSTPVHLVLQVREALAMMHEEGLENVFVRHESMAQMVRDKLPELGLSPQCPELQRLSPTLTAIAVPEGVTPNAIRNQMRARGILLAGGLGHFADSAFRIGHLGDIRPADVDWTLGVLGDVLHEVRAGTAV